jgi:hypothetical protein
MRQEAPKMAYDALLKFTWNEYIPEEILRNDTENLLLKNGANLSKCDIYINYDRDHSYVKIMPNRSLNDFAPEELDAFGRIADLIQSSL